MVLGWPVGLAAQSILDIPVAPPGVHIPYGNGEFQFGELFLPEGRGPHPVAIVIHGGYWRARYDLRHIGHFCVALRKAGIAAWSLEYRRLGNKGGGFPGTFDDVWAGASYLQKIAGLDLRRVVATGHSAGDNLCSVAREADGRGTEGRGASRAGGGSSTGMGAEAER